MKRDWDQRVQHHARFWIATENYQTEESFTQSGQDTAHVLLKALTGLHQASWKILDIGCGIGRILKPLTKHFHALVRRCNPWFDEIQGIYQDGYD